MANLKTKHMKMRILYEIAQKEEIERDQLEAQGLSPEEINSTIKMRKTENFGSTKFNKTLPFEERDAIIKNLTATNIGLPATHLIKPSAKLMNEEIEKNFLSDKSNKLKGEVKSN